jgi:hypothetical protein
MQLDTHLLLETHRQHGAAISSSLASTNNDLIAVKVYVFDSELQSLEQTQPRPVQQICYKLRRTGQ